MIASGRRASHVGDFGCFLSSTAFASFVGAYGVAAAMAGRSSSIVAATATTSVFIVDVTFFRAGADCTRGRRR